MRNTCYDDFLNIASAEMVFTESGHTSRESANGLLTLEARFAGVTKKGDTNPIGDVRSVHLQSEKVDVFSFFFYPVKGLDQPIFACEFVNLNDKRLIVALDTPHCEDSSDSSSALASQHLLKDHFGFVKNNLPFPEWYAECASPLAVFWRSDQLCVFKDLMSRTANTWQSFTVLLDPALDPDNKFRFELQTKSDVEHDQFIQTYKHHHCINSPGLPLMNASFGEQWTNEFMHQRFFA